MLAAALHRKTPYSLKAVKIDTAEQFRMGIRPGSLSIGTMCHAASTAEIAEHVIADDVEQWYECVVPLDEGYSPVSHLKTVSMIFVVHILEFLSCIGIHSLNHCGIKRELCSKE